jgi:hypothetical protein
MNKFFLGGIAVVVIAAVAAWNVSVNLNSQKSELSDVSLANVEALASEGVGCIGSHFQIVPISGGYRCINNSGNSCCPIIF